MLLSPLTNTEINKMDRINRLEAAVARLETLMHASLLSSLHPPGQPTTPLLPGHPATIPNHPPTTPLPPPHPATTPSRPPHPPTTPLLPPHPAPRVEATNTPLPPRHPAPRVEATNTPLPPPHPATTPSRPPHPPTTPLLPPHPAPRVEATSTPLPPHPADPTVHHTVTVRGRLPSSVINKSALSLVGDVVKNNADLLRKEGKMGTMAVVLAREAFFGEDVMRQCTTKGYGDKPGLPLTELMQLKEELRNLYPHFMTSQAEFEEKWVKICDALSQACKRMRHKTSKK